MTALQHDPLSGVMCRGTHGLAVLDPSAQLRTDVVRELQATDAQVVRDLMDDYPQFETAMDRLPVLVRNDLSDESIRRILEADEVRKQQWSLDRSRYEIAAIHNIASHTVAKVESYMTVEKDRLDAIVDEYLTGPMGVEGKNALIAQP